MFKLFSGSVLTIKNYLKNQKLALFLGLLSLLSAQAQASCNLESAVTTAINSATSSVLSISLAGCETASGQASIVNDSTGGATLTQSTWAGSPASITVNFGPKDSGTVLVEITCSHCAGANKLNVLASKNSALQLSISPENSSAWVDQSVEIIAAVSKSKTPVAKARLKWTQLQGPAIASLFPGTESTTGKGLSQLRVVAHTPGYYQFMATACADSSATKTDCTNPAEAIFGLLISPRVKPDFDNVLFGAAVVSPLVGTVNANNNPKVKYASLTAQTSTDINGALNIDIPLSAVYLFGETGFTGQSVNWTVSAGASLSTGNTPVTTSDGLVTTNFQASTSGTYFVTATGTCPSNLSSEVCSPPIQNFRIQINAPSLLSISGNNQSAGFGQVLAAPIVVQAQNASVGVPGVTIAWSIVSGSATLGSASSITNAVGLASNTLTMGNAAGPIVIRAQRSDASSAFVLLNANAVAAQLTRASPAVVSGSSSGGFNLTTFSNFAGIPSSAGQVYWTSSIPAQTNFSSAATAIDAAGRSNVTVTTTQGGSFLITACWNSAGTGCVAGDPTTTFTVNSNSLRIVSGNSQALAVSQNSAPLTVQLLSGGFANPQTITWSISGPAALANATTTTNGSGNSSNTLAFVGAGDAIVTASWPSVAGTGQPTESVSFNLSASANAYRVTPNSSLNIGGTLGSPTNLSVDYTLNGAAATSLMTQWSIISGPGGGTLGSTTAVVIGNASSVNTFTPTVAGTYRIRVQGSCPATVDPDCPGNVVDFLVSTTAFAKTLRIVSGDGQSAANNAAFASPLVVLANDSGAPAIGVSIDWLVTNGDSVLSSGTSVTDNSGQASINVTAGPTSGANIITATRQDDPTAFATFNLSVGTNTYTLVANGSTTIDLPLGYGVYLSANYTINGSPAIGRNILWSTASGSVTDPSVAVDAFGNAQTIYFPINVAGSYTVTADGDCPVTPDAACPPTPVVFTINVIDETLTLDSGDAQTTPLATPYPAPLRVQAFNNGVAVAGVEVFWQVINGVGLFTSPVPSYTDASGFATATLDAGTIAGAVDVQAYRTDSGASVIFNLQATGNVYSLTTVTPDPVTMNAGDTVTLDTSYLVNGVGDPSLETVWSTTGGTLGVTNSPVDNAGNSSNTITIPTAGTYTVTINGTCPVAPDPACPTTPVTYTINVIAIVRTLTIEAGNNQTTPLGTSFPQSLLVLAEDDGSGVQNVTINWSITSGGATLSGLSSVTDSTGSAEIFVDATGTAGPIQITAERADSGASVVFDLNSTNANQLIVLSGDNQTGAINTPAGAPIVVQLSNGGGVGWENETIDWTVISGSAVLASGTSLTDFSGNAQIDFDFGSTTGPIQIQASSSTYSLSVITNHLAVAAAPTLAISNGDNQSTAANTAFAIPLDVLAENSASPTAGVIINWLVSSGDASLSAATSTTDALGIASINVTAGPTPGAVVITGTRQDDPTATVSFNLTITAAGTVRALTRTSGNGQAALINVAFTSPLVVNATDDGIAAPSISIDWVLASGSAVLSSGTSVTDAAGDASITVTAGAVVGPISITATRADNAAAGVTFDLTANPTPNSTLAIVAGNSQSGVIGSAANSPITVVLRDGFGNAIAAQSIAWSVISGPASLSAASSDTDASGQASNSISFGTTAGAVVIRASALAGSLNVDFSANAVMVSLAPATGNGQAAPVSTTLPVPLTIQISPPAGVFSASHSGTTKPLALNGVPITFAVTSGGGGISIINAVTNGAGQASTILTLGPTAGINTVTATVLGGPSITFNANGLTAAAASGGIAIVSGNNQVLDPATASSPLIIELRDSGGSVIAGATITWATTAGTLASPSSVTNASGQATNTIQFNGLGTVQVSATALAFGTPPVIFNLNLAVTNIPGLNSEQSSVANAIDTLCPALAASNTLSPEQRDLLQQCQSILGSAGIDVQDTIGALDELFSDVALAQANATMLAAQSQFQNLKARIAALRSGTGGTSFGGLALNSPSGSVPMTSLFEALTGGDNATDTSNNSSNFERWGFFATGSIGRGEMKAGSINPSFDYDINGLSAGVDYRLNDRLIVGTALGFTRQGTTLPGTDGSVNTDGWNISGYSTFYQQNNWYADAVLTYGKNSFDLQRHINYTLPLYGGGFTTVDQIANANTDGSMLSGTATFGRDFQIGGWAIGPYGRLTYTKLDFDAYQETLITGNGAGLGLTIDARRLTSLASVLGSKFAYSYSTDWGVLIPHLQLEWEYEFKDDPQQVQASFTYDPTGTPIFVTGNPLDRNYYRIGLGLSMILAQGRSGFIYYEKLLSRDQIDQDTLSLGLRMEF